MASNQIKKLKLFSDKNNVPISEITTAFEKILFERPNTVLTLSKGEVSFVEQFLEHQNNLEILNPIEESDYNFGDIGVDVTKDGPMMLDVEITGANVSLINNNLRKVKKIYDNVLPLLYPESYQIIMFLEKNPDGVIWRCKSPECSEYLDKLDSVTKLVEYIRRFERNVPKKCSSRRHPNEFHITKAGEIIFS